MPTSQVGLRPACTEAIACKICDEATILYGVVDMHRPCLTAGVSHPPLSGHPIYYRRCAGCGFFLRTRSTTGPKKISKRTSIMTAIWPLTLST